MHPYLNRAKKLIRRPVTAGIAHARSDCPCDQICHSRRHHSQVYSHTIKSRAAACIVSPHSAHILSGKKYCTSPLLQSNQFSTFLSEEEGNTDGRTNLLIPSNIPISNLLSPTTIDSFRSLPETQTVLDIIDGNISKDLGEANQTIKQAHENLQRSRDIFQSLAELHAATFLLEASLLSQIGQFEKAVAVITRYTRSSNKYNPVTMQFLKAKLLFHSGKFNHALSEYEDIFEYMETKVEQQVKSQQDQNSNDSEALSVLDGAAALTGVGLSKFMLHHTSRGDKDRVDDINKEEVIEAIQTATELLLESRQDAVLSARHSGLALDIGLAAVISLTNFGVVQRLIFDKKDQSIEHWKQGLEVLDQILRDSVNSATIIPDHKYQCIQSLRARLYCNIACVMLHLDGSLSDLNELPEVDEETLKQASEMAKMALIIYDEIQNGPQVSSDDVNSMMDDENLSQEDKEELKEMLKNNPDLFKEEGKQGEDSPNTSPLEREDRSLSPIWKYYHQAESARALGLVAVCYYHAGAAVTAEGLLQSALDASSSYPLGQCLKSKHDGVAFKGVSLSSPNLGLIACDVRLEYALLCGKWDKRKGDADKLHLDSSRIEKIGVLKEFGGSSMVVSGLVSSIWVLSSLDFH